MTVIPLCSNNPAALLKLKYNATDIKPEQVKYLLDSEDFAPVAIFNNEAIYVDRESYLRFKYYKDVKYMSVTRDLIRKLNDNPRQDS